jgi:hypothetical protein
MIDLLQGGALVLVSVWGEPGAVHAAVREGGATAILTLGCGDAGYPAIGARHPPAMRLERALRDLVGLVPQGLADTRPWLDHGRWEDGPGVRYEFLPSEGDSLHQVPVGPVHAGIIEPGHFRFTCNGETVVRLEERLGYVHKGIDALMQGASLERAGRLAGRVSGDSTVAYAFAFARAAEAALGVQVPPRAAAIRGVMAELERVANHVGDFGAVCNDASFAIMLAHCAILREGLLRAVGDCFGHRLMMDRIVPGGVSVDLDGGQIGVLRALVAEVRRDTDRLARLYDGTPSLLDRTVSTGFVRPELAQRFGAGGFVGRASGCDFDARRDVPYAPYDGMALAVPVRNDGDVNARLLVRLAEITAGLDLIEALLDALPDGPVLVDVPGGSGEGVAMVESFRGDVFVWLRLSGGSVERCHLRDPSWFQWPLLEAAINGNIIADFPLCNKSFNCSYSGHDL